MPRMGLGRPRRSPDSVCADRAYSNGLIRAYLRRRGIQHVIPEKSDSQGARLSKGSRGGRPQPFAWTKTADVILDKVIAAQSLPQDTS